MISRRNYIVISIMFLILFFMFQFSVVMKERLNDYTTNKYEAAINTGFTEENVYTLITAQTTQDLPADRNYAVYIGDADKDAAGQVVTWWCTYAKRALINISSLEEYSVPDTHLPEAVIIEGSTLNLETDGEKLLSIAEQGINLIFSGLPDSDDILNHQEMWELFGIREIRRKSIQLTGMHLFEGFLLGGEAIYQPENEEEEKRQDLNLEIPWFVTGEGTKTYLMGFLEDDNIKDEELPAIIWRNSMKQGKVFCVNGDYLCNISGIGILQAMMAEIHSYEIYPVINAQNLVVANYPGFADENQEEMRKRYSQSQTSLFLEVIWPDLVSVLLRTNNQLTCMITPQFEYYDENEPNIEKIKYFLRLLQEEYGEAGLSAETMSRTTLVNKLQKDDKFWNEALPGYSFLSLYLTDETKIRQTLATEHLSKLRTIAMGYEKSTKPTISYTHGGVTLQRGTSSGAEYTYSDDIYTKCMETALGYSNIVMDLTSVSYPESDDDSWEKVSKNISANVCTYWKPFEVFAMTTLSESDQKIRRFLALDYSSTREENLIDLKIANFEKEAWFLLRTHDESIKEINGASYEKVEKNVYLINAFSSHVEIEVKKNELYYYEEKG